MILPAFFSLETKKARAAQLFTANKNKCNKPHQVIAARSLQAVLVPNEL
jgi:hypothetical protein